ncbi:MAG: hypothetical protein ACJ8DJ_19300 [Gemmatimonadales bacterium]
MMGCLSAPVRLIGWLGLIAALAFGWLYRDRLLREGRRLLPGHAEGAPGASGGRPGVRALEAARSKVDSLNGWRADSVVLTAAEVASLMGSGLDPAFRKELDSLQVELLEGEVAVHARLRTARLPKELVGPLGVALRAYEPVEAVGPLRVLGPGAGEWAVRSLRIRDFPLPDAMVPRLVSRALDDPSRHTVPWRVPAGVRAVRLHDGSATLYGAARP